MMRADVSAFAPAHQGRQGARVLFAGGDGTHVVGSAAAHAVLPGRVERLVAVALAEGHRSVQRQGESRQLKLFPSEVAPSEDDEQVAQVLIDRVRLERTRHFGECFLGLELWRRLELDGFFASVLDRAEDEADVPWSQVTALLAINRLCVPGSELAVEQRWFPSTALDDLLSIDAEKINDTRLYRCLDRLLPHKGALERHLRQRYGELFAAQFDVLLYDLTSSYVEGAAASTWWARRAASSESSTANCWPTTGSRCAPMWRSSWCPRREGRKPISYAAPRRARKKSRPSAAAFQCAWRRRSRRSRSVWPRAGCATAARLSAAGSHPGAPSPGRRSV
jgi:Domain of unknown function (DUF4277)